MIELTSVDGVKFAIKTKSIASVIISEHGTRISVNGGWTYYVKESYEEVLQMIRGNELETK